MDEHLCPAPSSCSRQWVPLDPPRELSVSMLAGRLVQDHLTQGHLTWCPRLRNSWERECLVPGTWQVSPGSRAARSRANGHGLGARCARPFSTCCVCAKSSVSTRRVGPFVRSSCGNRPAACTQTVRSALAARGCPSACRAGDRSALAAQGRASVLAQVPPVFGSCRRASSGSAQRT